MRAPFQILAIPYRRNKDCILFCAFRRSDSDLWQFIAGGGEDSETPSEAAKREIYEESGIECNDFISLTSMCYLPVTIFPMLKNYNWQKDTYVIPEYAFGFECNEDISLSREHTECVWMTYEKAKEILAYDSNKTAMYELFRRLTAI